MVPPARTDEAAAPRVLGKVVFGGSVVYTNPWDWWWTQKNWLQPALSGHQLWAKLCDFSMIRKVLLVPSGKSESLSSLLIQPMPGNAPRLPTMRRSGQQFSP